MPRRKTEFINDEIYHITLRGVDGRQIFMNDEDYWRGIFGLYEFNTIKAITIREQREKRKKFKLSRGRDSGKAEQEDKRIKLIEIISFVFMPNHIHLLLRQTMSNGIALFVQKFGGGYAMYFNTKYKRKGALFQGRFDAKIISGDEYLKSAFVYIHVNPISLIEPGWKEKGIANPIKANDFLKTYRWSSYLDYLGKKNFPSVTSREFLINIFGGAGMIEEFVSAWIGYKNKIRN
jgi:REP element-mobilizing transposase RayT